MRIRMRMAMHHELRESDVSAGVATVSLTFILADEVFHCPADARQSRLGRVDPRRQIVQHPTVKRTTDG